MLKEATEIIRLLWKGDTTDHYGDYFVVENAHVYTLPERPPPIYIAAAGPKSAELAGEIGDGLIGTSPDADLVDRFRQAAGDRKPCYAEMSVCWARSEREAKQIAYEVWPVAAIKGELMQELRVPAHFEQAAKMLDEDDVAKVVVCGPDPEKHVKEIEKFADAGFSRIAIHQIGPDQEGFFRFYEKEVRPNL
jgi:G6PDH family F420-dependent oxidoreductase